MCCPPKCGDHTKLKMKPQTDDHAVMTYIISAMLWVGIIKWWLWRYRATKARMKHNELLEAHTEAVK